MELVQVPGRVLAKVALSAAVVAAGVAWGVARPPHAPPYYLVDDLVAGGLRAHEGELVKVHGYIQPGTIERLYGDDNLHRFMLSRGGVGLRVDMTGPLPDTFRDRADVIVTGRIAHEDAWTLAGNAVIAKCPTRYDGGPATLEPKFK